MSERKIKPLSVGMTVELAAWLRTEARRRGESVSRTVCALLERERDSHLGERVEDLEREVAALKRRAA